MTLVIPFLGPDDRELRYCLRSLSLHTDATDLIIIGRTAPKWLNCTHIPYADHRDPRWYHRNVWEKLQLVEAETFLWCADDVYLQQPWDGRYYATGTLGQIQTREGNPYHQTILNTRNLLGPDAIAYNTHCPINIRRSRLRGLQADFSVPYGYCIKTIYAQPETPVIASDLKIRGSRVPPLAGLPWFSSSPQCLGKLLPLLAKMYPVRSKWEIVG